MTGIPRGEGGALAPANGLQLQLAPDLYTADSQLLMQQRGILRANETMEDALTRVVDSLTRLDTDLNGGVADGQFRDDVVRLINNGTVVFGTPVLTNAGREGSTTAACTVLPVRVREGKVDIGAFRADSMAALDKAIGTGYDLSSLENPATALTELNDQLDSINDHLLARNQRPVASMATLRADHPKVMEFVGAKRDVDFRRWRFNISVVVTEELFEAALAGRPWELHDESGAVVNTVDPNDLLAYIADCAHYCGEPGILFGDRINADNPTPQWEYKSTAPCAEVAMAEGEACQFSYINMAALVRNGEFDQEGFGDAVRIMTRLLDASVEHTIRSTDDEVKLPLVEQKRRVGVGITGFADLLVALKIPYNDERAVVLASQVSELLDYHSKKESVALARKRGAFPAYGVSRFLDPEWVSRKLVRSTGVVPMEDWRLLIEEMNEHGIRHASTTAMPPTGTSSTIVGASKSLEPLFSLTDHRGNWVRSVREAFADAEHILAGVLGQGAMRTTAMLDPEALRHVPHLVTARQIDPAVHLEVQAGFQSFLDESMAKTINLPNSSSVEDVLAGLWDAYRLNLKGITVFRDNCLSERKHVETA